MTFRLNSWSSYDHVEGFASGEDTSFDFDPNGTVTGKLGCNDFTAEAVFSGSHVAFRAARLTTDRTCAEQNMKDEQFLLETLRRSLNYGYVAYSAGMTMGHDLVSMDKATGLIFTVVRDR